MICFKVEKGGGLGLNTMGTIGSSSDGRDSSSHGTGSSSDERDSSPDSTEFSAGLNKSSSGELEPSTIGGADLHGFSGRGRRGFLFEGSV